MPDCLLVSWSCSIAVQVLSRNGGYWWDTNGGYWWNVDGGYWFKFCSATTTIDNSFNIYCGFRPVTNVVQSVVGGFGCCVVVCFWVNVC